MKIVRIEVIPTGYDYGTSCELESYELDNLSGMGIEEVRYWYAYGSYEGSGQMLMLKAGKWHHHDMGHCSCYGPTDHVVLASGFDTLDQLIASCSDDLKKQLACLVMPNQTDSRPDAAAGSGTADPRVGGI